MGLQKLSVWPITDKTELHELWSSMKMSKSNPKTCIFVHDSEDEIRTKIKEAFCPEKEIEYNPILDWVKHLIFPLRKQFLVKREAKFGGDVSYESSEKLEQDYAAGLLHPLDLKNAVAEVLIDILAPARNHFASGEPKKMLTEMQAF